MLSVALVVVGWVLGWWVFGRPRAIQVATPTSATTAGHARTSPAAAGASTMSVIIPARDEARTLPLLLNDLATSLPHGAEVFVVDDDSSDDTADVARAYPFVTVLQASGRPSGWVGKTWACHVGAQAANSETLCFVDADVRIAPGGLEALSGELRSRGGLVSVHPWHQIEKPYENGSALFGVISLMGIGAGADGDAQGAFGPLLMTTRSDYELVGGHCAVRGELVEDLALARRYHDLHRPVSAFTGGDAIRYRMYPDGPAQLVEGWTKNFATGASDTGVPRLAAVAAWLSAMGTTLVMFSDVLAGSLPAAVAVALYLAFALQLRSMFRPVGSFSMLAAALYPALMLMFMAVFFRSLWCTLVRRQVGWRGRKVAIGSRSVS